MPHCRKISDKKICAHPPCSGVKIIAGRPPATGWGASKTVPAVVPKQAMFSRARECSKALWRVCFLESGPTAPPPSELEWGTKWGRQFLLCLKKQ